MNRLFSVAFKRILKSLSVEEIKPEKINSILQSNNIKPVGDFILYRLPKQQTLQLLKIPCPIQNVTSEQNKQIRKASKSLRASQNIQEEKVCNQCPHKGTCQEFAKPGQPSKTNCVPDFLLFLQAVNQKCALDDQIQYRKVMHGYKACDSIIAMIEDLKQGGTEALQYQKIRQQRILLKQQAQKNQVLKKPPKSPQMIDKRIKRQVKKQLQKQIKQEQQPIIKNTNNEKQRPIKMKQQNLNTSKQRKSKQQSQAQFQMFEDEQEPVRQKRGQKYNRSQQQEYQQYEQPKQMRRGTNNQNYNRTRIENAPNQRQRYNYNERQRSYENNQAKRSRSSNDFKYDNNRRYQQNRPNFRQQQYQQERPTYRQRQRTQYGKNAGNANNYRNKQPNTSRRNTNKQNESDGFDSKFQKAGQIYRNTKIFESWQQLDDEPQQKTRKQKPRNIKQQIPEPSKPVNVYAQPRENGSTSTQSTEGTGQNTRRRGRNIRR